MGLLAVETGVFPLYEVINGEYRLSFDFPNLKPVREYLKEQGRFRHLTDDIVEAIQDRVDDEYQKLMEKVK